MATVCAVCARAQDVPSSLADQVARARHQRFEPPLKEEVAGRVVENVYQNDFFGLTIKPLPGWEMLNRGQLNVNEAIGRQATGMPAGISGQQSGRVFGMHDAAGSSVILSIRPSRRVPTRNGSSRS